MVLPTLTPRERETVLCANPPTDLGARTPNNIADIGRVEVVALDHCHPAPWTRAFSTYK
jgi:hypothetical protein